MLFWKLFYDVNMFCYRAVLVIKVKKELQEPQ